MSSAGSEPLVLSHSEAAARRRVGELIESLKKR
jgi:hypothetical protein